MKKKDFNDLLTYKTFLLRIAEAKRALNFIIFNEISKVPEDYFTDVEYDEDDCDMSDYIYKPSNPLKIQLDTVCLNIYFHKNSYTNIDDGESYFYSICINDNPLYYVDYRVSEYGTIIENEELFNKRMDPDPDDLVFLNEIFSQYNYYNKGSLELNDLFNAFIKDDEDES